MYKAYDPEGNPILFNNLTELRAFFDLSPEETKKCFYPGVHILDSGIEIITYKNFDTQKDVVL